MSTTSSKVVTGVTLTFVFIGIVSISAWLALSRIEQASQNNIRESLHTVMQTTHDALQTWIRFRLDDVDELAQNPRVIALSEALLDKHQNHQDTIDSPSLNALRTLLSPKIAKHDDRGFFIIAPDRTSIASLRDANIGSENFIHRHRRLYLDRVFAGETLFIPPIHSDVPLDTPSGLLQEKLPTLFVAAPVRAPRGNVIAALAFRLDPSSDFTRIAQLGRVGKSGETYAFDDQGTLISESRFDSQLRRIGLISADGRGMLSIRIADPGGNMLRGFAPDMPAEQRPLTLMASSAITGQSSHNTAGYRDYRGVPVVGTWLWDKNLGFGMATEIDLDEAMHPYYKTRFTIILVLTLTVLLALGLLLLLLGFERNTKAMLRKANLALEDKVTARTRELKSSEEKFRTIFESSADAMVLQDANGFTDCNQATLRLFNCASREEFIARHPIDWSYTENENGQHHDRLDIDQHIARAIHKGHHAFEWHYVKTNGEYFPAEVLYTPLQMNSGTVIQGTIRDISKRKQAEEEVASLHRELQRLSYLDSLTGIANRRMFDQTLEKEWNRAKRHQRPLSLMLIDIDYFKQYNDTYGHQQGDACLKQVANTLTRVMQRAGDLVARYGGEEFILLLPDTDNRQVAKLAEKARQAVHALNIPHQSSEIDRVITISVGVSTMFPAAGKHPMSLISHADELLYKAKENGRNRVEVPFW